MSHTWTFGGYKYHTFLDELFSRKCKQGKGEGKV